MKKTFVGILLAGRTRQQVAVVAAPQADAVAEHDFQEALERIVAGLETQTAGRITQGGRDISVLPPAPSCNWAGASSGSMSAC